MPAQPITRADINRWLHDALNSEVLVEEEIESVVADEHGHRQVRWVKNTVSKTKAQLVADTLLRMGLGYRARVEGENGEKVVKTYEPNPEILKFVWDRTHGKIPVAGDSGQSNAPDIAGEISEKLRSLCNGMNLTSEASGS